MTAFRRGLLRRMSAGSGIDQRTLSANERRQANDLCHFGWADQQNGRYLATDAGRVAAGIQ